MNAIKIKRKFITEFGLPLPIRFGRNLLINLTKFLPEYLQQTNINDLLLIFESYYNELYDGSSKYYSNEIKL